MSEWEEKEGERKKQTLTHTLSRTNEKKEEEIIHSFTLHWKIAKLLFLQKFSALTFYLNFNEMKREQKLYRNSNERHHRRIEEEKKKHWYMYIVRNVCIMCWTIVAVCIRRTFSESFSMCGFCFVSFFLFLAPTHTHSHSLTLPLIPLYYNCIYLVYMRKCFLLFHSLAHVWFQFCACNSFDFLWKLNCSYVCLSCQKIGIIIENLEKGAQIKLQRIENNSFFSLQVNKEIGLVLIDFV